MLIEKGTILKIRHQRKGTFLAKAFGNFNTTDEWYPIAVANNNNTVNGFSQDWEPGEEMPCRGPLCISVEKVILIDEET